MTLSGLMSADTDPARSAVGRAAVFLDKDGTLIEDVPYNVDPRLIRFTPGAVEGLQLLRDAGMPLVLVSNQQGLASGQISAAGFARMRSALEKLLRHAGVELAGFHVCPHQAARIPGLGCACRKPQPGMLRAAALELGLDLKSSWMVGDILDDIEAGRRAGCRTVLVDCGNETEWKLSPLRAPHYRCATLLDAARRILDNRTHAASPRPLTSTETIQP